MDNEHVEDEEFLIVPIHQWPEVLVEMELNLEALAEVTRSYYYLGENTVQNPCVICLGLFDHMQLIRELPCRHQYHRNCIDK